MSINKTVASIMSNYGIPSSVWGPILQVESGGDPTVRAVTSREDSVGLFQLNRMGGLGTGYSVSQLQDPTLNATIAAQAMAPAYQAGLVKGLSGYSLTQYVAFNSGWPTSQGVSALNTDPVVKSYDAKLASAFGGSSAGPVGSTNYNENDAGISSSGGDGGTASVAAPTSLQGQLASLQAVQQGGGGTMGEVKSIGIMVLVCVLGVVLIYLGVKMLSGGETVIVGGGEN